MIRCTGCNREIYFGTVNGKKKPFEDPSFSQIHFCLQYMEKRSVEDKLIDLQNTAIKLKNLIRRLESKIRELEQRVGYD